MYVFGLSSVILFWLWLVMCRVFSSFCFDLQVWIVMVVLVLIVWCISDLSIGVGSGIVVWISVLLVFGLWMMKIDMVQVFFMVGCRCCVVIVSDSWQVFLWLWLYIICVVGVCCGCRWLLSVLLLLLVILMYGVGSVFSVVCIVVLYWVYCGVVMVVVVISIQVGWLCCVVCRQCISVGSELQLWQVRWCLVIWVGSGVVFGVVFGGVCWISRMVMEYFVGVFCGVVGL